MASAKTPLLNPYCRLHGIRDGPAISDLLGVPQGMLGGVFFVCFGTLRAPEFYAYLKRFKKKGQEAVQGDTVESS